MGVLLFHNETVGARAPYAPKVPPPMKVILHLTDGLDAVHELYTDNVYTSFGTLFRAIQTWDCCLWHNQEGTKRLHKVTDLQKGRMKGASIHTSSMDQ